MNKKVVSLVLVTGLVLILMINSVSAMTLIEGIKSVGESVIKILELVAKFLLGEEAGATNLFSRVLFLVLIFGIIWLSLKKVPLFDEHPPILVIIAAIVSILAVRGITSTGLIEAMMLPSKALGIALVSGIPFVIYFIVVNIGFADLPPIVRKIAWIFFAVIFIGLWINRMDELADSKALYIYLVTAIAALIMVFMDGTIKGLFAKIEADKLKNLNRQEMIANLKRKIKEIQEMVSEDIIDKSTANTLIKNYQRKIRYFGK